MKGIIDRAIQGIELEIIRAEKLFDQYDHQGISTTPVTEMLAKLHKDLTEAQALKTQFLADQSALHERMAEVDKELKQVRDHIAWHEKSIERWRYEEGTLVLKIDKLKKELDETVEARSQPAESDSQSPSGI